MNKIMGLCKRTFMHRSGRRRLFSRSTALIVSAAMVVGSLTFTWGGAGSESC